MERFNAEGMWQLWLQADMSSRHADHWQESEWTGNLGIGRFWPLTHRPWLQVWIGLGLDAGSHLQTLRDDRRDLFPDIADQYPIQESWPPQVRVAPTVQWVVPLGKAVGVRLDASYGSNFWLAKDADDPLTPAWGRSGRWGAGLETRLL